MESDHNIYWFNAYKCTHELLRLRGYKPEPGSGEVNIYKFVKLQESWIGDTTNLWQIFKHPIDPDIHVAFIDEKVESKNSAEYVSHIQFIQNQRDMMRDLPTKDKTVNFIMVLHDKTTIADKQLLVFAPSLVKRKDQVVVRPTLEMFEMMEMQLNPLKFALQPKMYHITDEAIKEQLRLRLIRDIAKKETTLEELLPHLHFGNPIATWYGAKIGDVFRFDRSMGGFQGYYRIVMPKPPVSDSSKKKATAAHEDVIIYE